MPMNELEKAASVAIEAAQLAGNYLRSNLGKATIAHRKALRDDLLNVDLASEEIILPFLRHHFPTYGTLSEEEGTTNTAGSYWIVDPVDGSANYQHGNPTYGIAIALIQDQITKIGIIYLPSSNELYQAIYQQGATCNGNTIKVSSIFNLANAIIHIGDFAKDGDHKENMFRVKTMRKLVDHVSRIRMIGTAATDLAYIANGRADALINYGANVWDIEAGKLLVTEAGGKTTRLPIRGHRDVNVFSNGIIHDELVQILKKRVNI